MTWPERITAVAGFGFTERQAGFLVTVMLHAGVCLGRHYCAFARISHGQKMHDFFGTLVDRGYARATPCGHNTARLYHIHHKPLYAAIGEPNNRYRKPTVLARAVERLMLLDAVLEGRDVEWLGSEQDKVRYFTLTRRIPLTSLPALIFRSPRGTTVRHFADKLPIGIGKDGRQHVFLYLVTSPLPMEFRLFLERHAELLRALPEWTIRVVMPRHLDGAATRYHQAFREHLGSALRPRVIDELRWYFQARNQSSKRDGRFQRAVKAFGAPRYIALYRMWVRAGNAALEATMSPVLGDAIARGTGKLECHVLPHTYRYLAPLVGTA